MWGWLALAVGAEVTATVSLRASNGFSRLLPSLITVAGYAVAFWSLSQALSRGMALGVAYGVWAAAGVALVALIGAFFLGESLTWTQAGGLLLIIGGVLALELGGAPAHA
ncbi:DMT family transporter [Pseudonocardia parietis]|jgi:small multidrug resistance pump|uniref:Small multidrug resistance pump n=1 Tax=Pseudonocardia parietis TaxID=570936 RepID=A0ABS4VK57_9PSEU|nr:multidrug efflux SMR transporter [Pseudonocardia parietis]MBP2364312.1 small multidrug resistance pump [Pseudonocardia parietis]